MTKFLELQPFYGFTTNNSGGVLTVTSGALFTSTSSSLRHIGTHAWTGRPSVSGGIAACHQTVEMDAGWHTIVDAGDARAFISSWIATTSSSSTVDNFRAGLEQLDGTGTPLGAIEYSPWIKPPDPIAPHQLLDVALLPGARQLRLHTEWRDDDGGTTARNAYINDLQVLLVNAPILGIIKATAYTVQNTQDDSLSVAKSTGYAVLGGTDLRIAKANLYVVHPAPVITHPRSWAQVIG